ncbi:MAG: hypothetical protein WAV31_06235 [Candidatus Moraniibacteriota bacterium]
MKIKISIPKTTISIPTVYDFRKYLGACIDIWKGPVEGDGLSGDDDVDHRSLLLKEVHFSDFVFDNCLQPGERDISMEEKLSRLKEKKDFIGFGVNVFIALWEDYQKKKKRSALEWFYNNCSISGMDFPGTMLKERYSEHRQLLWLVRCRGTSGGKWEYGFDRWYNYDTTLSVGMSVK